MQIIQIVNQYGKFIQGKEFGEILDAYNKDMTSIVLDNKRVNIVSSHKTDEKLIINIEVA